MPFEGYGALDDPYVYKGTEVLKNRLGIHDSAKLQAFEVEMSSLRAEEPLPVGYFDAAQYRKLHHHLFQDVYRWGGQYRSVRIEKGQNLFCYPEHIPVQMDELFGTLDHGEALRTGAFNLRRASCGVSGPPECDSSF